MASKDLGDFRESVPVTLVTRKTIRATAARLFEAWTRADHLLRWWGPANVTCLDAAVDLRVGGRYRIANQFPDGNVVWIAGEFEVIEPPHKLVYTWRLESQIRSERVTVQFQPRDGGATEVVVTHERIPDAQTRNQHEQGWIGCLNGLSQYVTTA